MKRVILILSLVLLAGWGCHREDVPGGTETLQTTVSRADESKALTAAGVKTFAVNDQIAVVYSQTGGSTAVAVSEKLTAGNLGRDNKVATFTVTFQDLDRTRDVTYIYPAQLADAEGNVQYSALDAQDGTLATLASRLDLATYTGTFAQHVTLANRLAVGQFSVKNEGGTDITASLASLSVNDGTHTYTVTRTPAAGPVWVAMRPVSDKTLRVTAVDGSRFYEKLATGKTLGAGRIYPVAVTMSSSHPFFSVSGTRKVVFASGNLQYQASTGAWRLAEHPYDCIGAANENISDKNTGWIDLFGWGTSGWVSGNSNCHPCDYDFDAYASSTGYGYGPRSGKDYTWDLTGDFAQADWGVHNAIGADPAGMWRTLSQEEWVYLLARTNSCAKVTVNGVKGVLFYPDVYSAPDGVTDPYSLEEWTLLESAGCVFLPYAGTRNKTTVMAVNTELHYWSTTHYEADQAWYLSADDSNSPSASGDSHQARYLGKAVRLVRDAR